MLSASELADRLARDAEAVCRHYHSAGRRAGNYWIVGDVANSKGRSLYVYLFGPRAGRWTDAATGQYGDLLNSFGKPAVLSTFATLPMKHGISCAFPNPNQRRPSEAEPPTFRGSTNRRRNARDACFA